MSEHSGVPGGSHKAALDFIDSLSTQAQDNFEKSQRLLSFSEYVALVMAHPTRHARSVAQYVRDCFDFFGYEDSAGPAGVARHYKLFDAPFDEGRDRLIGQDAGQRAFYRALTSCVQDGRIQRLVLLHGPNGSAKSSLISCVMRALEAYSHTEEGALYRFNWIFPADKIARESIGFGGGQGGTRAPSDSYAFLDDLDIDAKLVDELKDSPLLLIPAEQREALLQQALAESGDRGDVFVLSDYMRRGALSHKSKQVYEALLTSYKGDVKSVLRHVQVERFYISRRYRVSAVSIEPQLRVDASQRQVTADRSLQALPASLQNQSLFELHGDLIEGNRGVVEYNDFLKRPAEFNRYLLSTSEKGIVALDQAIVYLDALLVGSANETYLSAFKASPEYPSFNARLELIRMPYISNYLTEKRIYDEQITSAEIGKPIAPHCTTLAALWAVLTRMKRPDPDAYPEVLREVIGELTPLQKADLYAEGRTPDGLNADQVRELRGHIAFMIDEGASGEHYEGRLGASPREMKALLLRAAQSSDFPYLSPLAIIDEMRRLVREVSVYKFLQMKPDGPYYSHVDFIDVVEERYLDLVDHDVRRAMGLVDEERYGEFFNRYIDHVTHWLKNEKLYIKSTGRYEEPDENFMKEAEVMIGGVEDPKEFRNDLMSSIAAWSIDHPGQALVYPEIFPQHFDAIQRAYFEARREQIRRIEQNLLRYLEEDGRGMSEADKGQVKTMLDNLVEKLGYTRESAQEAVISLLKRRYAG